MFMSARLGSARTGPDRTGERLGRAEPSGTHSGRLLCTAAVGRRTLAPTCGARGRDRCAQTVGIFARAPNWLRRRPQTSAPPPPAPLIVSSAARRRETSSFRLQRLINQTCACSDRRVCRCGAQINHTVRTRSRARAANSILDATQRPNGATQRNCANPMSSTLIEVAARTCAGAREKWSVGVVFGSAAAEAAAFALAALVCSRVMFVVVVGAARRPKRLNSRNACERLSDKRTRIRL